jgi:predicted metal-binding membrane protein
VTADVEFPAAIDGGRGERRVQADPQTFPAGSSVLTASVWRDRVSYVVGTVLVVTAAIAWVGVIRQSVDMQPVMTSDTGAPSFSAAAVFLAAWGVMMAAMMLPSATPMIVMYEKITRNLAQGDHVVPTALFAAIYLSIWLGLGVLVYIAGVGMRALAETNPDLTGWLPRILAAVLVATGLYQFTTLKQACLRSCRTPVSFLMSHWRSGYAGTVKLAIAHSTYCVGCCVALMVVLVAAGAMSLPWVLLITAIVFVEKLLPRGDLFAQVAGVGFVVLGLAIAINPDLAAMVRGAPM